MTTYKAVFKDYNRPAVVIASGSFEECEKKVELYLSMFKVLGLEAEDWWVGEDNPDYLKYRYPSLYSK